MRPERLFTIDYMQVQPRRISGGLVDDTQSTAQLGGIRASAQLSKFRLYFTSPARQNKKWKPVLRVRMGIPLRKKKKKATCKIKNSLSDSEFNPSKSRIKVDTNTC
jgi:hypothetical protein